MNSSDFTMRQYYFRNVKNPYIYEDIINEISFNQRWDLVTNTDITNKIHAETLQLEPNNTGKDITVYQKKDDPTEILFTDIEDGYFTVHHSKYDPTTNQHIMGVKLKNNKNANIGFFSTIISLYVDALSRGYPIKISAIGPEIWKTYNAVIEKIAENNQNYWVSDVKKERLTDYNVEIYSRVIIPKSKSKLDYRNKMIEDLTSHESQ